MSASASSSMTGADNRMSAALRERLSHVLEFWNGQRWQPATSLELGSQGGPNTFRPEFNVIDCARGEHPPFKCYVASKNFTALVIDTMFHGIDRASRETGSSEDPHTDEGPSLARANSLRLYYTTQMAKDAATAGGVATLTRGSYRKWVVKDAQPAPQYSITVYRRQGDRRDSIFLRINTAQWVDESCVCQWRISVNLMSDQPSVRSLTVQNAHGSSQGLGATTWAGPGRFMNLLFSDNAYRCCTMPTNDAVSLAIEQLSGRSMQSTVPANIPLMMGQVAAGLARERFTVGAAVTRAYQVQSRPGENFTVECRVTSGQAPSNAAVIVL